MTEQEIKRAMALLDEDGLAKMAEIRVGRWVIVCADGVRGVFNSKRDAIGNHLYSMGQSPEDCKVTRYGAGDYNLSIPDEDGICRDFSLYRITPGNLLETMEYRISTLLPEWFFDIYSEEYKEWNQQPNALSE